MRGHLEIIELRTRKMKPNFVFLNDYECDTNWFETGDHATISLTNKDHPETLDLRFLVGMAVSVSSANESRCKALFQACKQAGATTVAACHVQTDKHAFDQTGWMEIYRG